MSHITHRGLTSQFALNGVRVVSIDYRLAPEAPFPAQLTDAVSAYKHLLLEDGVSEEKIFVGGDSAGGGLALSLAIWVRDHGVDEDIPMFAGLVLISPYVDLTHSSPTLTLGGNFEHDTLNAILNPEELPLWVFAWKCGPLEAHTDVSRKRFHEPTGTFLTPRTHQLNVPTPSPPPWPTRRKACRPPSGPLPPPTVLSEKTWPCRSRGWINWERARTWLIFTRTRYMCSR